MLGLPRLADGGRPQSCDCSAAAVQHWSGRRQDHGMHRPAGCCAGGTPGPLSPQGRWQVTCSCAACARLQSCHQCPPWRLACSLRLSDYQDLPAAAAAVQPVAGQRVQGLCPWTQHWLLHPSFGDVQRLLGSDHWMLCACLRQPLLPSCLLVLMSVLMRPPMLCSAW